MNDLVKNLFGSAQSLSPADRQELAELLIASLDDDQANLAAWTQTAHDRWEQHLASGDAESDAFGALGEARRQLQASRSK